jgi:hypothetical protein
LGHRELVIRDCVVAYSFCLHWATFISFRRIFGGAVITALLFAAAYVFWTYYPHGLPLPTKEAVPTAPAPPPPAAEGKPDIR